MLTHMEDLDDEIDALVKQRGISDNPDDELEDDEEIEDDEEVDDTPEQSYSGTFKELIRDSESFNQELLGHRYVAYLAGFIAGTGSFATATGSVRLTVRSTKNLDAVKVFADRANVRAAEGLYGPKGNMKPGVLVQLSGKPLHKLMTQIWDLLPEDRKLEYARARKKARIYQETV